MICMATNIMPSLEIIRGSTFTHRLVSIFLIWCECELCVYIIISSCVNKYMKLQWAQYLTPIFCI